MNGIEKMIEKILGEARDAEQAALDEAAERVEAMRAQAEKEAEAIRDRILGQTAREGEQIIARARATAAMTRRNVELAVRREMIDEAFTQAFARITELPVEEYCTMLCRMLCAAMIAQQESTDGLCGGDDEAEPVEAYEVVLNEADRQAVGKTLIAETRRALRGRLEPIALRKLVLSPETAKMAGGLILRCGDVETNCTFDVVFARHRASQEAEIGHILFG